jgi:hypothetical protein
LTTLSTEIFAFFLRICGALRKPRLLPAQGKSRIAPAAARLP